MKFQETSLPTTLIKNLDSFGYINLTDIQALTIEPMLKQKDIIAKAHTGSGKTLAFGIGVVLNTNEKTKHPSALVLAPTRELCDQIANELKKVAKYKPNTKILTLYGGVSYGRQKASLEHSSHIVIATPSRLLKHLKNNSLTLTNINTFVIDEVDKMLDMGFVEEIDELSSYLPKQKQTLAFSATMDGDTKALCEKLTLDAIFIESLEKPKELKEVFVKVSANRLETFLDVLYTYDIKSALVFVNTKQEASALTKKLHSKGIDALEFHGDLEQYDRHDSLVQFSNSSSPLLICTDIASRGLDIKELKFVISYEEALHEQTHKHRIGRTARMGSDGVAITLFEGERDGDFIDSSELKKAKNFTLSAPYITLVIEGGKKDKLRALDIVGTLTKALGVSKDDIGDINIYDKQTYVAISSNIADEVCKKLNQTTIKTKRFAIWTL
ncbi:MAG: DEAD/DEAH box helicase [Sulfurimonas sp.]|jgi:ATP-independent RNA helicase DbpA|nr:DEAD/DEAH box helicase [Sulfurimonadaceae bacterium]